MLENQYYVKSFKERIKVGTTPLQYEEKCGEGESVVTLVYLLSVKEIENEQKIETGMNEIGEEKKETLH